MDRMTTAWGRGQRTPAVEEAVEEAGQKQAGQEAPCCVGCSGEMFNLCFAKPNEDGSKKLLFCLGCADRSQMTEVVCKYEPRILADYVK
ncbi:hypothetical protein ACOMHN_056557 [Nucella lapillus]